MVFNSISNVFLLWLRMLTAGRLSLSDSFLPSSLLCASKDTPGSRSVATASTYSNLYKDTSTPINCKHGVKEYSSRPYRTRCQEQSKSRGVFFSFSWQFRGVQTPLICPIIQPCRWLPALIGLRGQVTDSASPLFPAPMKTRDLCSAGLEHVLDVLRHWNSEVRRVMQRQRQTSCSQARRCYALHNPDRNIKLRQCVIKKSPILWPPKVRGEDW